jgi:hypothetical protein
MLNPSCLRGVARVDGLGRATSWAGNQKRQTVMIVTGVTSDWEYLWAETIKRHSAFGGGKHD